MSVQNAASWGYFDCENVSFNTDILKNGGFPVHLLPKVCESGKIAGCLSDNWHTIPEGTPIGELEIRFWFCQKCVDTIVPNSFLIKIGVLL